MILHGGRDDNIITTSTSTTTTSTSTTTTTVPTTNINITTNKYGGRTSTTTVPITNINITTVPNVKDPPMKVARWKELSNDEKWEFQFNHLAAYKEKVGNLGMSRKYTIQYDDGKVVNIGKWLDNLKSAERTKQIDNKRLEQLKKIGLFSKNNEDILADNGDVVSFTGDRSEKLDPVLVESVDQLHISTISFPQNIEQLIELSMAETPIMNSQWITDDLLDELNILRPEPTTDISPDGNRDVAALAKKCESFFYADRRFCSVRQLEATLQEFSNSWGFTCSRHGMSFLCHYAPPRQKKESQGGADLVLVDSKSTSKPRTTCESVKEKVQCPFSIKFNFITVKKSLRDWMFDSDGKIKHKDCYPVKVTFCNYDHTCSPGVDSQRYAMKRSGSGTLNIEALQEMINLLREAGGALDNRLLRSMLKNVLPGHIALDDQYLRNFKKRMMRYVMDPSLISRRKQELDRLIHGQAIAADEVSTFDECVMGDNLRQLMIGQLTSKGSMWNVESYLIRCTKQLSGFDYRIWRSDEGRPLGIVWMTEMMKKRLLRFGTVLFVDYMKRKYNKESWPYCGPVILDGNNEIGVVGESLNLSESLDGYFFVLSSIFEMVPEFERSSVKLIFADDFINDSVLERLGMTTTILRADLWHLTHEQLPKYFGGFWNTIEEPMTRMLYSGSQGEWETAFTDVLGRVQQHPEYSMYIKKIYDSPQRYSKFMLQKVEGNLDRVGSSHVEQNHSSVVSALGNGASWKLEDQVHKLLLRQDTLQRSKNDNRLKYEMQHCRYVSSEGAKNADDRTARECLTEWAYNNLWMKSSYRHSTHLEAKYDPASNEHKVRDRSKPWDDTSCISIQPATERCTCNKRVAFEFQCGHEYIIDGRFRKDKYHLRWFSTKAYEAVESSRQVASLTNHDELPKEDSVDLVSMPHHDSLCREDSVLDNVPTNEHNSSAEDDVVGEVNCFTSNEDVDYQSDGVEEDVSYHDLKRLALEFVDSASKSKESRRAAFHFISEMLGAMRLSSDGSGVVHQMDTSILPDVATHFGATLSSMADKGITQSQSLLSMMPLPACPRQGGTQPKRYKSAMEKRKNNPVKGGGQSKSCGFCKQSGHQLNKCRTLNNYGARLTAMECTDLAQVVLHADAYVTEALPHERQNDTVFSSIPVKTSCVVIHARYAKKVSLTEINGHREFLLECTLLSIGGKYVELPMVNSEGTSSAIPLTKSLFTISAICQYAYSAGKSKHLISQLKRVYSSSNNVEQGDFGLPMSNEQIPVLASAERDTEYEYNKDIT